MIVLADEDFTRHGIERRNRDRVDRERKAQSIRMATGPKSYRVDESQPMFNGNAPSVGGGGSGAIDPITAGLATLLAGAALATRRRRGGERR